MNFTQIINPTNKKRYSIFNKDGKRLLKNYIRRYKLGGNSSRKSSRKSSTQSNNQANEQQKQTENKI